MATNNEPYADKSHDLNDDCPEVFGNSAKIWSAYIAEATKEDQALAQNCKGDMDAIIIFAALFSAIDTTFLVESYKSLKPDSGDATVRLLVQISQQLSSSNGSSLPSSGPAPFAPSTPALICNLFWFLSLGFSLACALAATLVQQWARNYVQVTDSHTLPADRARVRAYLYRGLQKFKMQTIVELIPMLLHVSLLLFFSGLVQSLLPFNLMIGYTSLIIFSLSFILYVGCTLLPLAFGDCPYRTPASAWCWSAVHSLRQHGYLGYQGLLERLAGIPTSMEEAAHLLAIHKSSERDARDHEAMQSVVQRLHGRGKLLDFIGNHDTSSTSSSDAQHIVMLSDSTDLLSRVIQMLADSVTMLSKDKEHRVVACLSTLNTLDTLWDRCKTPQRSKRFCVGVAEMAEIIKVLPREDLTLQHSLLPNTKVWRQQFFILLWSMLCTFFSDASKLYAYLSDLSSPSRIRGGRECLGQPYLTNGELHALTSSLSREMSAGSKLVVSGQPGMMSVLILQMKHVCSSFVDIIEQMNTFYIPGTMGSHLPLLRRRASTLYDVLGGSKDLLIAIHFLQLSALLHTYPLLAVKHKDECYQKLASNSKLISSLKLSPASQQRLASAVRSYCKQRRRCSVTRYIRHLSGTTLMEPSILMVDLLSIKAYTAKAAQSIVQTLDSGGKLLDFMTDLSPWRFVDHNHRPDLIRVRRLLGPSAGEQYIIVLLECTDVVARICRMLADFQTLPSEGKVPRVDLCLQILNMLDILWAQYTPPGLHTGSHIGPAQLAVAFKVGMVLALPSFHVADLTRWKRHFFQLLWRMLSTLFTNASRIYKELSNLIARHQTKHRPESPGISQQPTSMNDEFQALISSLSKDLSARNKFLVSGHLDVMSVHYPIIPQMKDVCSSFLALLDQVQNQISHDGIVAHPSSSTLGLAPSPMVVHDAMLREFEDLLISIHYLLLSTLIYAPRSAHNNFGDLVNNAKLLSGFNLPPTSQEKLGSALQLYCEHWLSRLNQPGNGHECSSLPEPSVLLLNAFTNKQNAGAIHEWLLKWLDEVMTGNNTGGLEFRCITDHVGALSQT